MSQYDKYFTNTATKEKSVVNTANPYDKYFGNSGTLNPFSGLTPQTDSTPSLLQRGMQAVTKIIPPARVNQASEMAYRAFQPSTAPPIDTELSQRLLERGNKPQAFASLAPKKVSPLDVAESTVLPVFEKTQRAIGLPFEALTSVAPKAVQAGSQFAAQKVNQWLGSTQKQKSFKDLYKESPDLPQFISKQLQFGSSAPGTGKLTEMSTWENFLPEFLGQIASAGVASTVLAGIGNKIATQTKTFKVTPKQMGDIMTGRTSQGAPVPPDVKALVIKELSKRSNVKAIYKQAVFEGVDFTQIKPASPIRQMLAQYVGGKTEAEKTSIKIGGKDISIFKGETLNPKIVQNVITDTQKQITGSEQGSGQMHPEIAAKLEAIKKQPVESWGNLYKRMTEAVGNDPDTVQTIKNHLQTRWSSYINEPELSAEFAKEFVPAQAPTGQGTMAEQLSALTKQPVVPGGAIKPTMAEQLTSLQTEKPQIQPTEVKVARSMLPVTSEGDVKVSRLAARVKGVLGDASQETIDKMGLATYQTMNNEATIAKAAKFVEKSPEEAMKAVRGEIETPAGLPTNSLVVALSNYSRDNAALALKVGSLSSTRYGQEIEILKELDPTSPAAMINDIIKVSEKAFEKKSGVTRRHVEKAVNEAFSLKKAAPKKEAWADFVNEIIC